MTVRVGLSFLVFGGAEESWWRTDLAQRLPKEKMSIGKLVLPMFPEFCSLCFEAQGLVSPPPTAKKIGKRRPGTGYNATPYQFLDTLDAALRASREDL